jgi:hypothetical protein
MVTELKLLNKYIKQIFPFVISIDSVTIARINRFSDNTRLDVVVILSPIHYCEIHYNTKTEEKIIKLMEKETLPIFSSVLSEWDGKMIKFSFFPDINLFKPIIIEELNIVEEIEESPF